MKRSLLLKNGWVLFVFAMLLMLPRAAVAVPNEDIAVVHDTGNNILCPGCTKSSPTAAQNATKAFYNDYDDEFDFLFVFLQPFDAPNASDAGYLGHTYATAKGPTGTGAPVPAYQPINFGSSGKLKAVGDMYHVDGYTNDPYDPYVHYTIMGLETVTAPFSQIGMVGRAMMAYWGAYAKLAGGSTALLGSSGHWNYFFDTDGSVLGGNDFDMMSPGEYRTEVGGRHLSKLERYMMGLLPKADVGDMFYLTDTTSEHSSTDPPAHNPTDYFSQSTRHDFTIDDFTAANGTVDRSSAQKEFTCAFILVVPAGVDPRATDLAKLDKLRINFQSWFLDQTNDEATMHCQLGEGVEDGDDDPGDDKLCRDGEQRCNGNVVEICQSENWDFVSDCGVNLMCNKGECKDPDDISDGDGPDENCSSGQYRCKGDVLERCDFGNWTFAEDCAPREVCFNKQCMDPDDVDGDGAVNPDGDAGCTDNTDCPDGERCTTMGCVACPEGQNLVDGVCVGSGSGECLVNEDCPTGQRCTSQGCLPCPAGQEMIDRKSVV